MNRQSGPPPLMSFPMLNYNQFFTPADSINADQSRQTNDGMGPRGDMFNNGSPGYRYNDQGRYQQGREGQRQNKIEMQLNKALQKPVDLGRGESMMKKMGWSGGGLGRSGEGIVEPIAPNAAYATKKQGLGQAEVTEIKHHKPNLKHRRSKFANKKLNRSIKRQAKEMFKTNVLLQILNFVEDDSETELLFDKKLTNAERKVIHNLVEEIVGVDYLWDAENMEQMDIIQRILECNDYDLHTESSGAHPNRQLGLYKDAPDHMYLVIPEDLREDENDEHIEDIKVQSQLHENNKETQVDKGNEIIKVIDLIDEDCKNDKKYESSTPGNTSVKENHELKEGKSPEKDAENDDDLLKFNSEDSLKRKVGEEVDMDVCDKDNEALRLNKSHNGSTFKSVNNENQNEFFKINLKEKLDNSIKLNDDKILNFAESLDKSNEASVNLCKNNTFDAKISPTHNETQHKSENHNLGDKKADKLQNSKNSNIAAKQKVDGDLKNKLMESSKKLSATKKVLSLEQILEKVVDYFIDFSIDDGFTEFRFLGSFNEMEYAALVEFFKLCAGNTGENGEVANKLKKTLQSDIYNFNLQYNNNGSTVIYKVKKEI